MGIVDRRALAKNPDPSKARPQPIQQEDEIWDEGILKALRELNKGKDKSKNSPPKQEN